MRNYPVKAREIESQWSGRRPHQSSPGVNRLLRSIHCPMRSVAIGDLIWKWNYGRLSFWVWLLSLNTMTSSLSIWCKWHFLNFWGWRYSAWKHTIPCSPPTYSLMSMSVDSPGLLGIVCNQHWGAITAASKWCWALLLEENKICTIGHSMT